MKVTISKFKGYSYDKDMKLKGIEAANLKTHIVDELDEEMMDMVSGTHLEKVLLNEVHLYVKEDVDTLIQFLIRVKDGFAEGKKKYHVYTGTTGYSGVGGYTDYSGTSSYSGVSGNASSALTTFTSTGLFPIDADSQ